MAQANTKKYIFTDNENDHGTEYMKRFALISNSYKLTYKSLKFGPKWHFLYFKLFFVCHFVNIATIKIK